MVGEMIVEIMAWTSAIWMLARKAGFHNEHNQLIISATLNKKAYNRPDLPIAGIKEEKKKYGVCHGF